MIDIQAIKSDKVGEIPQAENVALLSEKNLTANHDELKVENSAIVLNEATKTPSLFEESLSQIENGVD